MRNGDTARVTATGQDARYSISRLLPGKQFSRNRMTTWPVRAWSPGLHLWSRNGKDTMLPRLRPNGD
jgi:hypothetical protein